MEDKNVKRKPYSRKWRIKISKENPFKGNGEYKNIKRKNYSRKWRISILKENSSPGNRE